MDNIADALCISHVDNIQTRTAKALDIMFVLSVPSQPDFQVLVGPAWSTTPYEESVCKGFEKEILYANYRWTSIQVTRHSRRYAAERIPLREYFYSAQSTSNPQINYQRVR